MRVKDPVFTLNSPLVTLHWYSSWLKKNREWVWLQCTETGDLNYRTQIKVAGGVQKVEVKKFNPKLRRHTLHKVKRK